MDHLEKAVLYTGSYFMLFICATALIITSDLPLAMDALMYLAVCYVIWARDEILAHHIIGFTVHASSKRVTMLSSLLRIVLGLIIVKLLIMGLYQQVIIVYLIDYITWINCDKAFSQYITLCTIERMDNESKA